MKTENELIPTSEEMNTYQIMAKKASESQFFSKIGGEGGLLSIMLMARELGLPPMQALMGGMNVIQGKVEISPRIMNMMIRKAGHQLEILECTNASCTIRGRRKDTKETHSVTFTIEEARAAGLVRSGGGWEKYPSDMLFARCISRLARRLFTDVISSAYVEGEISDSSGQPEYIPNSAPIQSPELEQKPEAQEAEMVELPKMEIGEFVEKLKDIVGHEYHFNSMDVYLDHLKEKKKVDTQSIMKQALHPELAEKFCLTWQRWYEKNAESTDEALART